MPSICYVDLVFMSVQWKSAQVKLVCCVEGTNGLLVQLDQYVAAQNSNLGIDSCFSGATFDVELCSSQEVVLVMSVERMCRQAP